MNKISHRLICPLGFTVAVEKEFNLFGSKLSFTDTEVTIIYDGGEWDIEGKSTITKTIKFGDEDRETELKLDIKKRTGQSDYSFSVEMPSLTLIDVINLLGLPAVPKSIPKSLDDFGLKDIELSSKKEEGDTTFR